MPSETTSAEPLEAIKAELATYNHKPAYPHATFEELAADQATPSLPKSLIPDFARRLLEVAEPSTLRFLLAPLGENLDKEAVQEVLALSGNDPNLVYDLLGSYEGIVDKMGLEKLIEFLNDTAIPLELRWHRLKSFLEPNDTFRPKVIGSSEAGDMRCVYFQHETSLEDELFSFGLTVQDEKGTETTNIPVPDELKREVLIREHTLLQHNLIMEIYDFRTKPADSEIGAKIAELQANNNAIVALRNQREG
jgi:hypothetical protein